MKNAFFLFQLAAHCMNGSVGGADNPAHITGSDDFDSVLFVILVKAKKRVNVLSPA